MSKYCEQVGKIGLLLDFLHATNIVALKPLKLDCLHQTIE